MQGSLGLGKVREIRFYSRSGSFVPGQEISKYLFKVSEKSGFFLLNFAANYHVIRCFCIHRQFVLTIV